MLLASNLTSQKENLLLTTLFCSCIIRILSFTEHKLKAVPTQLLTELAVALATTKEGNYTT